MTSVPDQGCMSVPHLKGCQRHVVPPIYCNLMTEVDLEPVRGAVEILRAVKRQQAKLKEAEASARAAIQDAMGNADVGLLDGESAIHWPTFKESRFDSKAFRDDNPELWEQYKAAQEKRRFDVVD